MILSCWFRWSSVQHQCSVRSHQMQQLRPQEACYDAWTSPCFCQSVGMGSGWLLRSRVTKCVERERILRKLDASPWGEGSYQAKFSTKHIKNMYLFLSVACFVTPLLRTLCYDNWIPNRKRRTTDVRLDQWTCNTGWYDYCADHWQKCLGNFQTGMVSHK